MCGFFTTDELDDLLFEASEVARFLLEVEGTTLDIDEEIDIEDRITQVMRSVGEAAKTILRTRGEDADRETMSHGRGYDKPKKMQAPVEIAVSTPKKTKSKKETKDKASSHNPSIDPENPEQVVIFQGVIETPAIVVLPVIKSPSYTSSATIQVQGSCKDEIMNNINPNSNELEIAGDKKQ
jgi:hypothetical protein